MDMCTFRHASLRQYKPTLYVGLNVGLNKTENKVIHLLIENAAYNAEELAEKIGVTKRTIERTFASLQEKGFLERVGSKHDGRWMVIR